MDQVTSLDLPELTRMGDAVVETADELGRAVAGIPGWADTARDAVAGSLVCAAAGEAARGWQVTLTLLVGEVRDFGDGLQRAAEDYRAADVAAAARLRGSGVTP
ncbi:MAG: hypothetical protein ABW046_04355 [Actinoplanes sp.]